MTEKDQDLPPVPPQSEANGVNDNTTTEKEETPEAEELEKKSKDKVPEPTENVLKVRVDEDSHSIAHLTSEPLETPKKEHSPLEIHRDGHSITSSPAAKRKTSSVVPETTSITFIKNSLESIVAIKEVHKKYKDLEETCNKVIEILKTGEMPDELVLFEVLKLACEKPNIEGKIIALDCLGKIFTFNIFYEATMVPYRRNKPDIHSDADMEAPSTSNLNGNSDSMVPLIEAAINTISQCFDGEGTDEKLELQVLRVLTAAILNESMPVHGKVLLQAVRQIYNIFLLSLSSVNQGIAQATLTQVMNTIFEKVKSTKVYPSQSSVDISQDPIPDTTNEDISNEPLTEKLTLEALKNMNIVDDPTFNSDEIFGDENELAIKDAFLIFRSMSNLAIKVIENDSIDMRSHAIRSKLLSLHLIHWILKNHISCFQDENCCIVTGSGNEKTSLVEAVRKYLCLILSRNATSSLASVYEISLELYWIMISDLRNEFKSEIPVFLDEIYFPIAEIKTSTIHQKRYLLEIVYRITSDPKLTIEIYLNYDCDPNMPNVCETIVDYLTRYALTRIEATPIQRVAYRESLTRPISTYKLSQLPSLSVNKLSSHPLDPDASLNFPGDYALKMRGIDSLVAFLRSLNSFCGDSPRGSISYTNGVSDGSSTLHDVLGRNRSLTSGSIGSSTPDSPDASFTNLQIVDPEDPTQFKQRKTALLESIRLFNYSPKKGFKSFVANKFVDENDPVNIAKFLTSNDAIDKAALGEFLGEGDEKHTQIMHAFVELLNFKDLPFLDAVREFLQAFRLPGEGQKIDRFMLKFAERYFEQNPTFFQNAGTAYTLAFSVIMLNTDQHSPQVKNRMTLEDFIRNNRGIDDDKDLPREFLSQIFDDILTNEIILKSEQHAAMISNEAPVVTPALGIFGNRGVAKEAYMKASKELSSKTEQLVKSLRDNTKKNGKVIFYSASDNNLEQIKSVFENLWMSILAGLTPPFKDHDDDDTAKILLEGIKISIHLACLFDSDYARTSFIRALIQFCNLNNPEEIKDKNILAVYALLEVAVVEKSVLKASWKDILISISQIERLKLLSQGVDSQTIPDIINARLTHRSSVESSRSQQASTGLFASFTKKATASEQASFHHFNQKLSAEIISKIASTDLEVAVDKVFSKTSEIDGSGIFDFIAALTDVAWEEIESSGQSEHPRMFSLQKMVDVCYYNMGRIRVEWSALWAVMGEKFNEFGCHSNVHVVYFALDSLRQLSERFFEIEELAHFKFQREFLKPFDYIMVNNVDIGVKTMILDCVQYLIQKKSKHIKSGWIALLSILLHSAVINNESVVSKGYSYASMIARKHFSEVYQQGGFDSLAECLSEYAKNEKYQRSSLQAVQELKRLLKPISEIALQDPETKEAVFAQLAFPILFGFQDVIMTGDDLEVRSMALNFLFDSLVTYGAHFEGEFWDKICQELLFPIFGILKERWSIGSDQDDIAVWLSTTLIQALRNMIELFTVYFDTLSRMLDGYLTLLVSCICQENDTISKIGITCLKDILIKNATKFNDKQWNQVSDSFTELFDLTTAKELFSFDPLHNGSEGKSESNGRNGYNDDEDVDEEEEVNGLDADDSKIGMSANGTKDKSSIVIKCVFQLHMIQTLFDLFDNEVFYESIPVANLMKLCKLLEDSYNFSGKFNDDYNLRVRLWNAGVIDKLPNLLKQETASSGVYISIMFRLYCDSEKVDKAAKAKIVSTLIPMGVSILEKYIGLDENEQSRNINSWRPVVVEILQAYSQLDEPDFLQCCPTIYDLVVQLFDKSMMNDLRFAIKDFLRRVGDSYVNEQVESSNGAA